MDGESCVKEFDVGLVLLSYVFFFKLFVYFVITEDYFPIIDTNVADKRHALIPDSERGVCVFSSEVQSPDLGPWTSS